MIRHADLQHWTRWTIAVTGMNAKPDNPGPGCAVARCLRVVPEPPVELVRANAGRANTADLPLLVAALSNGCAWLVTFNVRHYRPGHPDVAVLSPGDFQLRVRDLLTRLG